MALPEGHRYRAAGDRSYRPRKATDDAVWERAFPLFAQILAADPRTLTDEHRLLSCRRSALARHLYWLAGDAPDQLNPDHALDAVTIERSALISEGHITRRSQLTFMSQLRAFRAGFPELFPPKMGVGVGSELGPISDRDFTIAMRVACAFQNPKTSSYIRALLLLARGAGADGSDCRFIAGTDVYWRSQAGLWVQIRRPQRQREVPVLARYQADLAALARAAGADVLIGVGQPPAAFNRANELIDLLKRRLRAQHPRLEFSTARLRKAWKLELLSNWPDLQIFLAAAGLKSMHGLEDLMRRCPVPAVDPVRDARLLGGIAASRDEAGSAPRLGGGRG